MFKLFFGPRPCLAVTHPELAREVLTRPKEFIKTSNDKVARHSISAPLNYTKVPCIEDVALKVIEGHKISLRMESLPAW